MLFLLLLPAGLQMLAMGVDEFVFHRRRGLPRWERLGHPLDTLTAILSYGWLVFTPTPSPGALATYIGLCAFSCLFITKDELVHARVCEPMETWLHAVLFVLHPIVFLGFGVLWQAGENPHFIQAELALTLGLLAHQLIYWSPFWQRTPSTVAGK